MSKSDKRETKIRQNTKGVSLLDYEWLINKYGSISKGGSHPMALIDGCPYPIPYARTKEVLVVYVLKLLNAIDLVKNNELTKSLTKK